jgi:choline dehydrogenase-like flavoprotein
MHTDARSLEDDALIETDLCIVGAGAAGISMAMNLLDAPFQVALLEGGGFSIDPALQALYGGEVVGQPYYPLEAAGLHYVGGTTGHWGGFCAPLDPVDFQQRAWVVDSGWPFGRETLDPYYVAASGLLELGPYAHFDVAEFESTDPHLRRLPLDERVAWTKMWQFSPPTRFGTRYREAIATAGNVHLYTNALVREIELNEAATAVRSLRIRGLDGRARVVRARHYVLACGAIQNARLLLASRSRMRAGIGNGRDLVGRYFMEHIEMPAAELFLAEPAAMKLYQLEYGRTRARGELALLASIQAEHRILNGTAELEPGAMDADPQTTFESLPPDMLEEIRRSAEERVTKPDQAPRPNLSPHRRFKVYTRFEQAPNPDSRITLSGERDATGLPRVRLDWRLKDIDKRSIRVFCELLGREFGRSGLGRLRLLDWLTADDATWPRPPSGGWHHMGTTRMHEDPRRGVVDPDCRVHGLANLHVAGASTFPTAGAANPTLTLVALSLRLARHLRGMMG